MKTKLVLILLLASTFFACKKESAADKSGDASGDKYYFKYTFGTEERGYSYKKNLMDLCPPSQWNLTSGLGREVIGGDYPNPSFGSAEMTAESANRILVTLFDNCNSYDRPKCFLAGIYLDKLAPGKYNVENGLSSFYIREVPDSPEAASVAFSSFEHPDETMSVTISSVEPVGGLVKGEFSGKLKVFKNGDDSNYQLLNISGKFAVVHIN